MAVLPTVIVKMVFACAMKGITVSIVLLVSIIGRILILLFGNIDTYHCFYVDLKNLETTA